VVDAAHTAASAAALARTLARIPRRRGHLVLSVSAGKDLAAICRSLVPFADQLTITRAEPVRSLEPEEVTAVVRSVAPELTPRVVPDPHRAVREAREGLGPEDLLCAAGSVYLAGIARRVLLEERRS
jgi:dihydrofolate synthase/folylpolyglutamate synthase